MRRAREGDADDEARYLHGYVGKPMDFEAPDLWRPGTSHVAKHGLKDGRVSDLCYSRGRPKGWRCERSELGVSKTGLDRRVAGVPSVS